MKRRGIQTSRDSTTHFGVSGQHLAITREMNAIEVIDEDAEVLLLELKGLTQRLAPIFSLGLRIEWVECERGWEELFAKGWMPISKYRVGNLPKEVRGSFYTPSLRYYCWGVRDPN
jgi:hypothetical protein